GNQQNRLYKCTNCNKHISFTAAFTGAQIQKLQDFVKGGGFVFCEDWVVKELLERAFPKYVTAGKVLLSDTVDVVPARGNLSHPYLRGIFSTVAKAKSASKEEEDEKGGRTVVVPPREIDPARAELVDVRFKWKIDNESFALDVQGSSVVPLLTSGELQKKTDGDGWVAVAFRPGHRLPIGQLTPRGTPGVVLAVLSHFGKQDSRLDEATLENLLLNFLIDANAARRAREVSRGRR
ncbi:MAG TPA: hypothetical protein VK116_14490, partial [Planctomycetota bacterium]|nr:hypothetical protein [Planctomycetota bacterium]